MSMASGGVLAACAIKHLPSDLKQTNTLLFPTTCKYFKSLWPSNLWVNTFIQGQTFWNVWCLKPASSKLPAQAYPQLRSLQPAQKINDIPEPDIEVASVINWWGQFALEIIWEYGRAQRIGFFQYQAGSGRVLKKGWLACGLESGRSVEIFDRVFPCTLLTLRYFQVYGVVKVYPIFGFTWNGGYT